MSVADFVCLVCCSVEVFSFYEAAVSSQTRAAQQPDTPNKIAYCRTLSSKCLLEGPLILQRTTVGVQHSLRSQQVNLRLLAETLAHGERHRLHRRNHSLRRALKVFFQLSMR